MTTVSSEQDVFASFNRPSRSRFRREQRSGHIKEILKKLKPSRDIRYDILCGNNRNLYNEIVSMRSENIQPLPYISSRDEMNQLYDSVDAVMTPRRAA